MVVFAIVVPVMRGGMPLLNPKNDRASRQEEQRLEEGMGDQVEHARHRRAHAYSRHHETQLADGGVCQHFFNIILPDSNCGGKERGQPAHPGNGCLGIRGKPVKRLGARHQVHACRHHRGGMDQRRDGCGTRHGIRQPDEERKLGGFAGYTEEHKERDGNQHTRSSRTGIGKDHIKIQRAKRPEHQEEGNQQAKITHAVDDECLLCRPGIPQPALAFFKPKTNQEIRTQTHAFPADKQHQEVVGTHQDHHCHDEEVEIHKEPAETPGVAVVADIFVHVADGVNVDESPHPADYQHHCDGKGIHPERPVQVERADGDPFRQFHNRAFRMAGQRQRQEDGDDKRGSRCRAGKPALPLFPQPFAHQQVQQQADQRRKHHPWRQGKGGIRN